MDVREGWAETVQWEVVGAGVAVQRWVPGGGGYAVVGPGLWVVKLYMALLGH